MWQKSCSADFYLRWKHRQMSIVIHVRPGRYMVAVTGKFRSDVIAGVVSKNNIGVRVIALYKLIRIPLL